MKWIVIPLLFVAGLAHGLDTLRITRTTEALPLSGTLAASGAFAYPGVAQVVCSATCWMAVHSTNTEAILAASASAYVLPYNAVYLSIPASGYHVIVRQDSDAGFAYVTGVEPVR